MNKQIVEQIAREVVDCGFVVHKEIGPGLLESAYQKCLLYELVNRGLQVEVEVPLPLVYKGVNLDCGYRLDVVVEGVIILELKSVEALLPIHTAQLLTYLKVSGISLGFLLNFNVTLFKQGVKRLVNNH